MKFLDHMQKVKLIWWFRWQRTCLQYRRCGFDPWIGKIPWRREWLLTPVFLPGEFQGQRSLAGYSPWGHKESDTVEWLTHNIHKASGLLHSKDVAQKSGQWAWEKHLISGQPESPCEFWSERRMPNFVKSLFLQVWQG